MTRMMGLATAATFPAFAAGRWRRRGLTMSLEGGFDEVDESFFSRAFSVSSCAILRFQLHDLGLQRRNRRFNQPGNLLLRESSWHSPVITDADTNAIPL